MQSDQHNVGLEYVTQTDRTGKIQWYHCSICDVKFDDNLKFPHLVGQKHRLNVLVSFCCNKFYPYCF
jgi:hypothetical protein